jgi:large subunit ribosomal protein L15
VYVDAASEAAIKAVEAAGGKVILPVATGSETQNDEKAG